MKPISYIVLLCSVAIVSAQRHSFLIPERRSEVSTNSPSEPMPYRYEIVPSSEYAMTSYQTEEPSILDYVLSPVTAIVSVGSTALSVAHWVIVNCGLVLLGMAIVIGFCAFTSHCTLIIENPFGRYLPSIPYLDDIQYYFNEAYIKYHGMQNK